MKIFSQRSQSARLTLRSGSVLVLTMIFCALIGIILVAYLSMLRAQHKFTHRSQTWNNCIPLCEAGVEEALAHMNHVNTTSNFAVNGWALWGGAYRKERTLNGGTVQMAIDMAVPPVITVTGYLRAPVQSNLLVRAVRVRTRINTQFHYAVLAKGSVTLNSGPTYIDSFDSRDPAKSTNGQYDPAKRGDQAIVATTSKTDGTINLGNVDIYGKLATGPGATVDLSKGSVGDIAFVSDSANDGKIQEGHVTDDVNLYVPDVQRPSPFAPMLPVGGVVAGVPYTYVLGNGDWALPSINGNSTTILVTGKARLYVGGNTFIGSAGSLMMAPGASLEFYADGDIDIKGVVNNPGLAKDCAIFGLPACKSIFANGGAQFNCTIYAPQADITVNGNANGGGAMVGNSIKLTGGMNWHYDEALRGDPRKGRYVASSWLEL